MPPKPQDQSPAPPDLTEVIANLAIQIAKLKTPMNRNHQSVTADIYDLRHKYETLTHAPPSPHTLNPPLSPPLSVTLTTILFPPHNNTTSPITLKPPKISLPLFDGSTPLEWIFQAEQFFCYYNVTSKNRLDFVSFHMTGDALCWFRWMTANHQLSSWDAFVRALELKFGPPPFDNHQATLFKLRQLESVAAY